jgi:uncharacterized cupin superfamily protein
MAAEIIGFTSLPAPEPSQPAVERCLEGAPRQNIWNVYSDPSAQFHAGRWSSDRGAWRVHYTEHEFCHLLAGRVRISSESGSVRSFEPGDSFVIPAGFRGVWTVEEPATKIYVIFEPREA